MAPLTTPHPRRSPPSPPSSSLPGIKRGIAIGCAVSLTILLIALLAYFALKQRTKQRKAALQSTPPKGTHDMVLPLPSPGPPPPYLPEKIQCGVIPPPPLVEADAQTIHELPATPPCVHVAELASKPQLEVQELDGKTVLERAGETAEGCKARSATPTLHLHIEHVGESDASHCREQSCGSQLVVSPMDGSPMCVSPLDERYRLSGDAERGAGRRFSWE
ncbi:hypothetical protein BDV95DRAFT_600686 [Massariosphaeria phaeospora]|uniref:Uncharacterized protein n=1 Tax=Massariosphaeria phaeospora TaxID=100035 RepID=A0A7C8IHU7_9PLEO|nr:hypothetical protein BDV95DRAFT_600686 [Massariosphaeria phaeospora]